MVSGKTPDGEGQAIKRGAGNDTLTGGQGGTGVGETDLLFGGGGIDTFVLGNETSVFYQGGDGPADDFALIQDFELGVDKIQLNVDNMGGYSFGVDTGGNALILFNNDVIGAVLGVDANTLVATPGSLVDPVG